MFTKEQVLEVLGSIQSVENTKIFEVHGEIAQEKRTREKDDLIHVANKLIELGKSLLQSEFLKVSEYGVSVKMPSFRVYASIDSVSDIPYIKMTATTTPKTPFELKESIETRLDKDFRQTFIDFVNQVVYSFITTAMGYENLVALNEVVEQVKSELEEEEREVAFDLRFQIARDSNKPIFFLTDTELVLGTTVDKLLELVGVNSQLQTLFVENADTAYIADAIKSTIKEDWTSSPNPLAFIRKHNAYLLPLVAGDLNTRRTQRADVLVKNSFTLEADGLGRRTRGIAHKLERDGDEMYISVFGKEAKDSEIQQLLSPINVKSLVYKS